MSTPAVRPRVLGVVHLQRTYTYHPFADQTGNGMDTLTAMSKFNQEPVVITMTLS